MMYVVRGVCGLIAKWKHERLIVVRRITCQYSGPIGIQFSLPFGITIRVPIARYCHTCNSNTSSPSHIKVEITFLKLNRTEYQAEYWAEYRIAHCDVPPAPSQHVLAATLSLSHDDIEGSWDSQVTKTMQLMLWEEKDTAVICCYIAAEGGTKLWEVA